MPEIASSSTLPKFHVTTDEQNGKPVTFDYSQEDVSSVITQEQLEGSPIKASIKGYSLVGAKISTHGTPGNVLIDGAPALEVGVNHWRFLGVPQSKGEYGCGISSVTGYGSGWKLSAFYLTSNGNIAGRGALKCGFVQNMPQLPMVDWIMEVSGSYVVDAYLFVNGVFKGHAGHLQFPDMQSIQALRPVVSFGDSSEDCRVVYISHEVMPIESSAFYKQVPQPSSIFDCKWRLVNSPLEAPESGIQLDMSPDGMSVKVMNSMRIGAEVGDDGSIQTTGSVASTMMMAPPMFQPAENQMSTMLESATGWSWDKQSLSISSGSETYKWEILRDEPVTENPLVAS